MRLIGLDVGDRRIGVAVSDPTGFLASAERVVLRKSIEKDLRALAALIDEFEAEAVVVGLPLHLNGSEGAQAASVRRLAESLQERISVPLIYWDERLSTAGAQRLLIEAGRSPSERAARLDAAAAAVILQGYLDNQRIKKQQEDCTLLTKGIARAAATVIAVLIVAVPCSPASLSCAPGWRPCSPQPSHVAGGRRAACSGSSWAPTSACVTARFRSRPAPTRRL